MNSSAVSKLISELEASGAEDIWTPVPEQQHFAGMRIHSNRHWRQQFNLSACESALNDLIKRHCILRTRYITDDNGRQLWAVTERERRTPVDYVDLSGLTPADREARFRRLTHPDMETPFFPCGPLLRLTVLKLSAGEFVSRFVVCHSIFDAASVPIYDAEFAALYRAAQSGKGATLEPLSLQFRDYARERNAISRSATGQAQLLYWRDKIRQFRNPVYIRANRHTPPAHCCADLAPVSGHIEADTFEALKRGVQANGCTLFLGVAVALGIAMKQAGSGTDFLLWTLRSRRTTPELARLIGPLVERMPVQFGFDGDPTYSELCARALLAFQDALQHADILAEQIHPLLGDIAAGPCTTPLVNFVRVRAPPANLVQGRKGSFYTGWVRLPADYLYELSLGFLESPTQLWWKLLYKETVYEDATIGRLSEYLLRVLSMVAHNPQIRLSQLELAVQGHAASDT